MLPASLFPGCTSGGLALAGRASSPTCSLRSAAVCTSPAATLGSEVVFAILSSAAAASRAWKWLGICTHALLFALLRQHKQNGEFPFRGESTKMHKSAFGSLMTRAEL